MSEEHEDDEIETFAVDEFDPIPSELHARVSNAMPHLRQVHVEYRNEHGRWLSTRQKISWKSEPKQSPEEITSSLVAWSRKHADAHGYERYRAVLTLQDPIRREVKRVRVQLNAAVTALGEIEITDDPNEDFSQREHLDLMTRIIERQEEQNKFLFEEVRELHGAMRDTVATLTQTLVDQSKEHAAGIVAIGENVGGVVEASTKTLKSAAELHDAKNSETTVVQLAKMEQEGKRQQIQFAMQMLNKIGGPLVKQLSGLFSDKKGGGASAKKSAPEALPQPEESEEEDLNEEQITVPREELAARLEAWRAKLSDEQRAQLRTIVGDLHFEALSKASDQPSTERALQALMGTFKWLQDEGNLEELASKLMALNEVLGDQMGAEFGAMINTMDDG